MKIFSNPVFFIKLVFATFLLLLVVLFAIAIGVAMSGQLYAAEYSENAPEIYALDTMPAIEAQNIEAEQIAMPASAGLVDLVRGTLLMVNAGNQTGDYSVLYANLTPPVQKNVDVNLLAQALAGFREEKVDMSAVSMMSPQFVKPPEIDTNGRLSLNGYFPMQKGVLRFNLGYRNLNGHWRLEAIDLDAADGTESTASRPSVMPKDAKAVTSGNDGINPENETSQTSVYVEPPTTTKW
jgi:hypothetical protein